MGKRTWTNEEIEFLKENYVKYGNKFCTQKLNKSASSIEHKASRIGLAGTRKGKDSQTKPFEEYKFNPKHFLKIKEPIIAYFLGLLWADGYVEKKTHKIVINANKNDLNEIIPHLRKMGDFTIRTIIVDGYKDNLCVMIHNYFIHKFLVDNDYKIKSGASADKILSHIPDNLKHYFFRGLSDGDGCFYHNKFKSFKYDIASSYEQNWDYLENVYKELNLNHTIYRVEKEKSSYSTIYISNRKHITFWGDYIYQNYENDNIGFRRKYDKYLEIKKYYEETKDLTKVK